MLPYVKSQQRAADRGDKTLHRRGRSGDMTERSVNYLTGRQKTVTGGNMFEDVPAAKIKTRWQTLPKQPARYLDGPSLPSPQDWE